VCTLRFRPLRFWVFIQVTRSVGVFIAFSCARLVYIIHGVRCTVYRYYGTLTTVYVNSVECTVYSVQCTVRRYTVYSSHSALVYSVQCTIRCTV
jgi:hypothetical protein